MNRIETEILVIGGGATGLGVAWDAALRGFRVVLVEKRDLTHGTTGRYHGLLHSGARYVVNDPETAVECISENRILRRTHAPCIEDTGGYFVVTPEDEGDYPDQFKKACARAGVPCVEIRVAEALRREPFLNPRISRVFRVPDGSADSFMAAHLTAAAAQQAGAQILNYHQVNELLVEGNEGNRRVVGARVRDVARGEDLEIHAAMTVNAAGAWSGQIGKMAGLTVNVIPGKGTMVAFNHRIVNTVINRCEMPGDGDILVPAHTVCVLGTTDERVADPDNLAIEPWEIELLLDEGDKLVPGLSRSRVLRAWAGVRPLYQENYSGASREAKRDIALLDHRQRDGMSGFLSILGGKWTTFRLMAEKTMDKACEQLGTRKPCITATTPVSGNAQGHFWLGHRLQEVEENKLQQELICECELVTRAMLENAAGSHPVVTMDDLRRDLRIGMGPCQGGFCTFRAAGILHELQSRQRDKETGSQVGRYQVEKEEGRTVGRYQVSEAQSQETGPDGKVWQVAELQSPEHNVKSRNNQLDTPVPSLGNPNLLLRDFLQERWKGVTPILWGLQLKQERLDELIYLSLLNADHLPDQELSSPMSDFYESTSEAGPKDKVPHV